LRQVHTRMESQYSISVTKNKNHKNLWLTITTFIVVIVFYLLNIYLLVKKQRNK